MSQPSLSALEGDMTSRLVIDCPWHAAFTRLCVGQHNHVVQGVIHGVHSGSAMNDDYTYRLARRQVPSAAKLKVDDRPTCNLSCNPGTSTPVPGKFLTQSGCCSNRQASLCRLIWLSRTSQTKPHATLQQASARFKHRRRLRSHSRERI